VKSRCCPATVILIPKHIGINVPADFATVPPRAEQEGAGAGRARIPDFVPDLS